jgi:hypothetical protein
VIAYIVNARFINDNLAVTLVVPGWGLRGLREGTFSKRHFHRGSRRKMEKRFCMR